eukprot:2789748-Amphidinium_carterae.1
MGNDQFQSARAFRRRSGCDTTTPCARTTDFEWSEVRKARPANGPLVVREWVWQLVASLHPLVPEFRFPRAKNVVGSRMGRAHVLPCLRLSQRPIFGPNHVPHRFTDEGTGDLVLLACMQCSAYAQRRWAALARPCPGPRPAHAGLSYLRRGTDP